MTLKNYESLKSQYPKYISLDQLRIICKIAKRSARYLVTHEIIPAIDTGQATWRYQIAIDDVIAYLHRRDKVGSMIPPGMASSRTKRHPKKRALYYRLLDNESEVAAYFGYIYADYGDVLTTDDLVEMTGFAKNTILKYLKSGYIKSLASSPKYVIPKAYLLEFVTSSRFIEARSESKRFIKILGGFEIWKTAKSSQ